MMVEERRWLTPEQFNETYALCSFLPGGNIIKYGNGPLDVTLMEHGLIDEFHLLLTPVAVGKGQHLFEDIESAPSLNLIDVTRHSNGVVILTYTPK